MTNAYVNRLRSGLSLQQPTGVWTNKFVYDPARRLTNVTSQAGTFRYLFSPDTVSRHVTELLLPNSSWITNQYDSVGRMLSTWLLSSAPLTLDYAAYGYNLAGQRTNHDIGDGTTYTYTYDKIGQLTGANSTTDSEDRGYTYDTAWNLNYRTNNGSLSTFTVDGKNQLTSAFGAGDTYDGNGNLTGANNNHDVYEYDDENQLIEYFHYQNGVNNPITGDTRTFFDYDGLRRLRKRREYVLTCSGTGGGSAAQSSGVQPDSGGGNNCTWGQVSETDYIYDGMRVIQERNGSNTPTVSYTRGTDLGGTFQGAGGIGGLLARSDGYSSGNWTSHNYYHADGNGNITYLVNSSQSLAASYRYDPFGNLISSSGTLASANVYRFSSKEIHAASGMYYYGYRFYDPNLQRWVNRDLIGERGGENLYMFVYNNPQSFVDPVGLAGMGELHMCEEGRNPFPQRTPPQGPVIFQKQGDRGTWSWGIAPPFGTPATNIQGGGGVAYPIVVNFPTNPIPSTGPTNTPSTNPTSGPTTNPLPIIPFPTLPTNGSGAGTNGTAKNTP